MLKSVKPIFSHVPDTIFVNYQVEDGQSTIENRQSTIPKSASSMILSS